MRTELVTIRDGDVRLDGAWYEPDDPTASRGAVLLLHGNVSNFYTGPSRFLPPSLTAAGFACLAFNRRGHDIVANDVGRDLSGGAFQTGAEGLEDDDVAARWLAARGHVDPIVVGHSNGGLLGACFAATHPETRALVLLSAHLGGRDIYRRNCAAGMMGADRGDEFEALARELVAAGRGDELLVLPGWTWVISAASLVDRIDATPALMDQAPRVTCPTLTLRGSLEPAETYPMAAFAAATAGEAETVVIDGSDHWYGGHEDRVAAAVVGWLTRHA